jgi:hypothetical protein
LCGPVAFEEVMGVRKIFSLLVVAAAFLAAASSSQAKTSQFTLFEAPRELLSSNDGLRAQTFDQIQGMGVGWLRVVVIWRNVDANGWGAYDREITEARARGMKVLVTLSGPIPKSASGNHRSYTYKPNAAKFQQFVADAGTRYRDAVNLWSIWNEPNHPDFLSPQFVGRKGHKRPYSPALYRKLFFAAKRGLNASGNSRDKVLMGETAPRGTGREVAPLRFLRGVLAPRGRFPADGYAHHAYTTASGPWFRPHNPDDVTIGVLSRLTHALDAEARKHRIRRGMPIYLTEFGIQSKPDPFIGVSWQAQAEYRSISEQIAYRNRRVVAFSQYLMRDDDPRPGSIYSRYSGFESGLMTAGGKDKLSFNGFRMPLVADARGKHVYLWGLIRPATGRTRLLVQIRKRGSKRFRNFKHVTTNSRGYWSSRTSLRKGAQYRVVWGGYTGPATRAY